MSVHQCFQQGSDIFCHNEPLISERRTAKIEQNHCQNWHFFLRFTVHPYNHKIQSRSFFNRFVSNFDTHHKTAPRIEKKNFSVLLLQYNHKIQSRPFFSNFHQLLNFWYWSQKHFQNWPFFSLSRLFAWLYLRFALWWLDLNLLSGPDVLQKGRSWN